MSGCILNLDSYLSLHSFISKQRYFRERDELKEINNKMAQQIRELSLKMDEYLCEKESLTSKIAQYENERNSSYSSKCDSTQIPPNNEPHSYTWPQSWMPVQAFSPELSMFRSTVCQSAGFGGNKCRKTFDLAIFCEKVLGSNELIDYASNPKYPMHDQHTVEIMKRLSPELSWMASLFQSQRPSGGSPQGFIRIKNSS